MHVETRLRLQYRLVLCVVTTLGLCLAGVFLFARSILLAGYEDTGNRHAYLHLERAKEALRSYSEALHERSSEWAAWDDTYNYLKNRNRKFLDENVTVDSLLPLHIDAMLLVDRNGRLLHGQTIPRLPGVPPPDTESLYSLLRFGHPGTWPSSGDGLFGFVDHNACPLAISVRPVFNSKGKGPSTGWIVLARYLDSSALKHIGDKLGLDLTWYAAGAMDAPLDARHILATHQSAVGLVRPLNDTKIAGYTWIYDIHDRRIRLLRMVSGRAIYAAGVASMDRFMRIVALITLLFGCVMVGLLNRSVVSRIARITRHAASIARESQGLVPIDGRDEIGGLASQMNGMLNALYRSRQEAEDSRRQLNTVNAGLEHLVEERTRELNRAYEVLSNALDGIGVFTEAGVCLDANLALLAMLDATEEQAYGLHWHAFVPYEERQLVEEALERLRTETRCEIETTIVSLTGGTMAAQITFVSRHRSDGSLETYHWFLRDISDRKRLESHIRHQAEYDSLCNIPNRILFHRRVTEALRRRQKDEIAVLFVDLDNFKLVNDSLGHEEGDRLLKTVAERLSACVRETDVVARMGGDEFTLLLQPVNTVWDAASIAQRIVDRLVEPVTLAGREVFVSASVGVAISDKNSDTESLLRDSDTAMYQAKQRGKSGFAIFAAEMQEDTLQRLEMESALRTALEHNELVLMYQPLIDLKTGGIYGAEALVRWQSPQFGNVSPDRFIPIAEETGLIVPIGEWILREACRQAAEWNGPQQNLDLVIAVNLSARQAMSNDLVPMVESVLAETGLLPSHLKLEITETLMMTNVEKSIRNLEEVRSLGVSIAIDDFGTGYSSLSYLQQLPVDTVKIDRSFIGAITPESQDTGIVPAIINLCSALRLKVVAEGIETESHRRLLTELGCDFGQGYLFSRPVSAAEFEAYLATTHLRQMRRAA
jgi:diguanylate cyclase (GGDEF)-like protein/PAS domain S-box-containing protein